MLFSPSAMVIIIRFILETQAPLPHTFRMRLKSVKSEVRQIAVISLVCKRNKYEYRALRKALKDRHSLVRWRAVIGLSGCESEQAIKSLGSVLFDKEHFIRIAVILGLARFRGKKT